MRVICGVLCAVVLFALVLFGERAVRAGVARARVARARAVRASLVKFVKRKIFLNLYCKMRVFNVYLFLARSS